MAEEEETREVLFPDWKGADETGLTIEQTSEGEIFVRGVRGESPAARSGKVYEGDQIVGATVYFDNMSPEETAELLKTLNRHKVGLKLQNKGDKSPGYSPLSTPCRSPMGTLTWEGRTRFGSSSPDILLSGDDEEYKRIYTKKIKPRLKSEDLAEGVDVRTERHSSTSSDGSTITTITRRITTYTVEMPGGISEELELSSPDVKGLRHESGDGSPGVRILHGSPSGKTAAVSETEVFDSSNISHAGPQVSLKETHWGRGGVQTTVTTKDGDRVAGLKLKGPDFGEIKQEGIELMRGSGEKRGDIQVSGTGVTLRGSTNTGSRHIAFGGMGEAEADSDERKGSIKMSLPAKTVQTSTPSIQKTQETKVDISDVKIAGASTGSKTELKTNKTNVSTPNVEFNLKGPTLKSELDIDRKEINIRKPTEGENESIDITFEKTEMKIPSFGSKGPKIEMKGVDINIPKADIDVKVPGVGTKTPEISIKGPDGKIKSQDIKSPTISGSKIGTSAINVNLTGDVDLSVPKIDGDIKTNIKCPETNITGEMRGFKMATTNIPSVDVKGPILEDLGVNGNLPKPKINVKARDFAIEAPKIDIGGTDTTLKDPKFEPPSIKTAKMPGIDIKLKGPKLDVSSSSPAVKGDLSAPALDVKEADIDTEGGLKMPKIKGIRVEAQDIGIAKGNIDVKVPDVDFKAPELNIEGPDKKIKGPEFNLQSLSGPKISMPGVGLNLSGPKLKGDVDVSVPKIEGDIKAPDFNVTGPEVNIGGETGGFKMPKFKIPTFAAKGPKLEGPDVDVNLPEAEINVKAPDVDINAPEIDIEGPDGKVKGPKFNLPSMKTPKLPGFDINLKGPKVEGDVDISVPTLTGNITAPEVDVEGPDIGVEGPEGGFKMPKVKLPKFGFKGPQVEAPDVDINIPKANIDVKVPDVDIKAPEIDIEGPEGKITGPKLKLPSFSGPKISMPDVGLNLSGPKLKGDVDVSVPKIDGNIKAPKVDVKGPEVNIGGESGGFKMPTIKMPSFGGKSPKLEGPEFDVNLPKAGINVKAPSVDIKGCEMNIDRPDGKIKGAKFHVPSLSGPKISMPDVDFHLSGPRHEGDVSVPKIEGDIKAPKVDVRAPKVGLKMPQIDFEGSSVQVPQMDVNIPSSDLNVEGPTAKLKGDVKLATPSIDGSLDCGVPSITSQGVSVDHVKTGVRFPKFKGPKFGIKSPEIESPESTVKVKVPKAQINVSGIDASIDAPDIDIKGKRGKFKLPKVKGKTKKPDFEVDTPAINLEVDSPNIHVKGTKVKKPLFGKLHFPDVEIDIKSPKHKGDGSLSSDVDLPSASLNISPDKGKDVNMPKVTMSSPDVDANLSTHTEGSISASHIGPRLNVKGGAEFDGGVSAAAVPCGLNFPEGAVTFPKLKIPKFGFLYTEDLDGEGGHLDSAALKIQSPSISCQASSPNIQVPSPEVRYNESKVKVKMPRLFGKSKQKVGSAGDLQGPEIELGARGKDVHAEKELGGKFELQGNPGLSVSSKSKSASLDVFKIRHRSSLSDEAGLNVSSSPHLEAGSGDISLDLGGGKIKGKKGKLKFGTFGGFGSKSKGSYEVTLGEGADTGAEGSAGVSQTFKKSRLSSSSSSDSGGGLKLPKVELTVSPKK